MTRSVVAKLERAGGIGALVIAALLVPGFARADKVADAEDLFRRAKALMAQGKHEEACPMLRESYKSDPAPGTLLNLALCHERIGKTASAWGEFRVVEQQSRAASPPREDRVKIAREHAEKLEPRLSRIKLVVPAATRTAGLVIKIDGEEKGEPLWSGVPVDPGTRTVEATATHKKPTVMKVKIDDEGVLQTVTIPALADAAPPASAAGVEQMEEYAENRARRTTGFVVGGLGLAVLATGAVFGVAAVINDSEAKKCAAPCTRGAGAGERDAATDRAFAFANIANVTVPLGLLGAAIGGYLVLSAGPSKKPLAFSTMTSPSLAGLSMSGTW